MHDLQQILDLMLNYLLQHSIFGAAYFTYASLFAAAFDVQAFFYFASFVYDGARLIWAALFAGASYASFVRASVA